MWTTWTWRRRSQLPESLQILWWHESGLNPNLDSSENSTGAHCSCDHWPYCWVPCNLRPRFSLLLLLHHHHHHHHWSDNCQRQIKRSSFLIPRIPVIPIDMSFELNNCRFPFDLLFDDYQQSTRSIASRVSTKSWKCIIFIWTITCLHVCEWEIPQNYSFLRKMEKQKKSWMSLHFNK